MPSHHLPQEMLMAYAAGTVGEAHGLLCAVHLTLCPTCRDDLALYEQLGGALLEGMPVTTNDVDAAPLQWAPAAAAVELLDGPLPDGAEQWPRALHPYARGRKWSWQSPGIHMLTTPLMLAQMPVRLFRLAAGQRVPHHTHLGTELSLVLSGGFTDLDEHYGHGDLAARDSEISHDLRIDDDGPCVTLVVNEHPLVPLTLAGKLYARIRRP